MKRSIRLLSSLGIQSLCLRALFLCLITSGCGYHTNWVREPFGPGTGPSIEHCCYPGPGCGHGGGCVETECCEVECCETGCGGCDPGCTPSCCPPSCAPAGCDCGTTCVPPVTLCNVPPGCRGGLGHGPVRHHGPLTWVFGALGFGGCGCAHGGCGELYLGDFHGDPPDVCDPCDSFGNYTGGCCGCGDQVYPPRPACAGGCSAGCSDGCSDCMTGTPASGYPMTGDGVYTEGQPISPRPSASPSNAPRYQTNPSPASTLPATNGKTSHIDYNLPPGAKIISETDHVQTAAPRPTLAPRRR